MSTWAELKGLNGSQKGAIAASFLGWTLDAFDFFLMILMIKAISTEFHTDVKAVTVAVALTLAARPAGAFVFGLLADRFGRRPILMLDVLLYSGIGFASAFAPSLAVLIVLRMLFGFAMGGEWGVGASLVMESIPPKTRGLVSGLLQEGYAAGYLLAALAFWLLFDRIGWRGMFMLSALPAVLTVMIRFWVRESPVFEARKASSDHQTGGVVTLAAALGLFAIALPLWAFTQGWADLRPFIYLGYVPVGLMAIWLFRKHLLLAVYVMILMTAFNFFSHGTQDLYPTFLKVQHHMSTQQVGLITAFMNVGAITGGLIFGAWSEKLGRKWAIIVAALLALPIIPLWAFAGGPLLLALGAFLMQISVQGAWGIMPAHLNEMAPAAVRGMFPGFLYQMGNLFASNNGPFQAHLAESRHDDYGFALAVVAGCAALAIAVITFLGRERKGVDLHSAT